MHLVRTIAIGLVLATGLAETVSAQPVGASSYGGGYNSGSSWNGHNGSDWNRPNRPRRPDWRRGDYTGEAGAAAIDNYYNNCNPEAEYCGGRNVTPPYRNRPMLQPPLGGYSAQSGE
jgi:hypothetical protein